MRYFTRRELFTKVSAMALPISILSHKSMFAQNPQPPKSLKIGEKALLRAADFSFLGWFRLPVIHTLPNLGDDFMFSTGALSSRTVDGQRRFFMPTGPSGGYSCIEFTEAASYSGSLTKATPKGSLVRTWGDIYKGKRELLDEPYPQVTGYFWDDDKLWWLLRRSYAADIYNDPCLGCSVLNDGTGSSTSYGKWRLSPLPSSRYSHFITRIPSSFCDVYTPGRQFGIGANQGTSYGSTPYGPNLNAFAFPALGTPPDTYLGGQRNGPASVTTTTLIGYDINNRCTINGRQYRRFEGPYGCGPYPTADAASLDISSSWAEQVDETANCAWIDLPDKQGVIWFGQLCDALPGYISPGDPLGLPHMGYGNPQGSDYPMGRPARFCCHGQDDPYWQATGPFCHSTVPWMFIMNPSKFIAVVQGTQQPWYTAPDGAFRLSNIVNLSTHPSGRVRRYCFGGVVFDASRRLLFVAVNEIDGFDTMYGRPAIIVLRIS